MLSPVRFKYVFADCDDGKNTQSVCHKIADQLTRKDLAFMKDYYAVAMTTLIALYSALSASYLIRGERLRKTADRLIAAPVHKGEIFAGRSSRRAETGL